MKKTSRFAALALCSAMALACTGTGIGLFAHADEAGPQGEVSSTTVEDKEWVNFPYNTTWTTAYDTETQEHIISPHGYDGFDLARVSSYKYKVHVDGLKLTVKGTGLADPGSICFGWNLAKNQFDAPDNGTMSASQGGYLTYVGSFRHCNDDPNHSQVRYNSGTGHAGGNYILYGSEDDAKNLTKPVETFGSTYVFDGYNKSTHPADVAITVEFNYIRESDVYSVTLTDACGYRYSQQNATRMLYMNKQYIDSVVDESGDCYITAYIYYAITTFSIKIENDENYNTYKSTELKAADDAIEAYETAIEQVTDEATFQTSIERRTEAQTAIQALRGNDQPSYEAKLAEADRKYVSDEGIQTQVRGVLQKSFDPATTAINLIKDEATLTNENIIASAEPIATAKAKYNDMKAMLTEVNDEYFTGLIADYDYSVSLATAKLWIIDLEKLNKGIEDAEPEEAPTLIQEAKTYLQGYDSSNAKTIIENTLKPEDKTALETRLQTARTRLDTLEEEKSSAVKELYLSEFESAVEEDLTDLDNLQAAKAALRKLEESVTLTEGDGEQYERYTSAKADLKQALEAYVNKQISDVDAALNREYGAWAAYNTAVNVPFNKINLNLLLEENATVTAAYEALKTKKAGQLFDAFNVVSQTGVAEAEQNSTGIFYENDGIHPSHLNYNKPLDFTKGVEIEVEINEFFCTDCGDAFENRSNNLVFNFLKGTNEYRGGDDANTGGFTMMIWLFDGQCNVVIYDSRTDDQIATIGHITTPMEGSTLTISVAYKMQYGALGEELGKQWAISVNGEAENVVPESVITKNGVPGLVEGDSAIGYFSMGSYANEAVYDKYPDGTNAMTLIRIGSETFAKEESVSSVSVKASKTEAKTNEKVTFTATPAPSGATYQSVSWTVNGEKQSANGLTFEYTPSAAGTYKIVCEIDGVKSSEVTLTVTAESTTDPGTTDPGTTEPGTTDPGTTEPGTNDPQEEKKGCLSVIGVGGACLSVLLVAAGVVLLTKKKDRN